MGKKTKQREEEQAPPKAGFAGYFVGALIGLVALVGLWSASQQPPSDVINELPHLAILVEFNDLADPTTRAEIARLHEALAKTGLVVEGPKNFPILVPNKTPGEWPIPKNLEDLTPDELAAAKPFLKAGTWLVPRIYAPDLKSCVLRAAPLRGNFPPGSRQAVEDVLAQFKGFAGLVAYSHALGLESADARNRLNVVFGVQTANVRGLSLEKQMRDANRLVQLDRDLRKFKDTKNRVRSLVTLGSWFEYVIDVRAGTDEPPLPGPGEDKQLWALTEQARLPVAGWVTADGSRFTVGVTTQCEDVENYETVVNVAANLRDESETKLQVSFSHDRRR